MHKLGLLIFLSLLLIGCSEKQHKSIPQADLAYKKQWVNPIFFRDEFEKELSFPNWFSADEVKKHRIQKITRRIYPNDLDSIFDRSELKTILPLEKREYYFDPNGLVDRYVVYVYYDDREISRKEYRFLGNMRADGYRLVERVFMNEKKDTTYIKSEFNTDYQNVRNDANMLFSLVTANHKFSAFKDKETEEHIFEVKKRRYWGALSIDSILHPQVNDWIILGTAKKPFKRYKVENTVNESHVHSYSYSPKGLLIKKSMEEYPFERKRYFEYNKHSRWTAFTDSIFSENVFIYSKKYVWKFDQYGRPNHLLEQRIKNELSHNYFIETYDYQTYK
jgi:hypothetical protein